MATFEQQFTAFAKFGDTASDGKVLNLSKSDKWMKQAKVFDKNLTTTDSAITFNKFKKKTLTLAEYKQYVEALAKAKNVDPKVLFDKMTSCGAPGLSGVTETTTDDITARMTDTSKFTGSHKERFDKDGKGKGKDGRE
ncbi:tubulin polymerization-promoting protein homolog [Venturia canescens]|uniref:tubulin polymerization-promoting protein homolog n=1 Tax=Venturia canescens TaxID=32260 RepID=UPI001C9BEED9|nr:tubulin polymerization-promoting protein homolog [Venturia canescens]